MENNENNIDVGTIYIKKLEDEISKTNKEKLILDTNVDVLNKILEKKDAEFLELKQQYSNILTSKDQEIEELKQKNHTVTNQLRDKEYDNKDLLREVDEVKTKNAVLNRDLTDITNKFHHLQNEFIIKTTPKVKKTKSLNSNPLVNG